MTIAIVGIGLIGGSLALALRNCGFASAIIGVDHNPEHISKAIDLGLMDREADLFDAVCQADITILSVPVNTIQRLLPACLDRVGDNIVIDTGSTKARIVAEVDDHPKRKQFVACHPMAGTEFSGPEAAIPNLYTNKVVVVCDKEKSAPEALQKVEALFKAIQMQIVYHDAEEHDMHTAYVSHISHISSMALALTVLEKEKNERRIFELASGGFSSTVRLAKSNPDTWIPIFQENRDNVLDVLDEHINTISKFRTLLIKKDFETFYKMIEEANDIKRILKN